MAIMNYLGNGTEKNVTRFNYYMELAKKNEESLAVPVYLVQNLAKLDDISFTSLLEDSFSLFDVYMKDTVLSGAALIIVLYSVFILNLLKQQS